MSLRFRIYYGWFDPETGEVKVWTFEGAGRESAKIAPNQNVQVIVNEEPWRTDGKRGLQHGTDCYCWRDDQGWCGMDFMGREHYLAELGFGKIVLWGRSQRNAAFHACLRGALKEGLG